MLEILGIIFGGIFSGGATGLLGMVAQRYFDMKNRKLDIDLERERRVTEIAKADKLIEASKIEWKGRADTEAEKGDSAAFVKSVWEQPVRYSHAPTLSKGQQWIMVVLDAMRGVIVPFLTVYLCALTTYVWFQVRGLMSAEDIDIIAALEVWKMVVGTILYLTTTCVLWHFGTRNRQDYNGQKDK